MSFAPGVSPTGYPYAVADGGNGSIIEQYATLAEAEDAQPDYPGSRILVYRNSGWFPVEVAQ